jgi:hypothetical protein
VSSATTAVTLSPTFIDPGAYGYVNTTFVTAGVPYTASSLAVGNNSFDLVAYAPNGLDYMIYHFTIVRAADSTAPNAPSGLLATATSSSIALSWSASSESDVASYRVYKNGTLFTTVPTGTLSTILNSLLELTSYSLQVSAVDNAGNESIKSSALIVTTRESSLYMSTPQTVTSGSLQLNGFKQEIPMSLSSFDFRDLTGLNSGWKLRLSASPVLEKVGLGFSFPTGSLTINPNLLVSPTGFNTNGSPHILLATSTSIDIGPVTLVNAGVGEGAGSYQISFPTNALTLHVDPKYALVDQIYYPLVSTPYESTLTWNISVGP